MTNYTHGILRGGQNIPLVSSVEDKNIPLVSSVEDKIYPWYPPLMTNYTPGILRGGQIIPLVSSVEDKLYPWYPPCRTNYRCREQCFQWVIRNTAEPQFNEHEFPIYQTIILVSWNLSTYINPRL